MRVLEPATTLSPAELADAFTAAYEGYVIPFALTAPALRFMLEAFDYDLDGSLVARVDGEPVGLAMLGLRGAEAWCGGVGVVPAARGQGLGEELMRALQDSARSRGARRMWLEVIEQNTAAVRLYEKLGYEHVRDVEVWSLTGGAGDARESRAVHVDEALRTIRAGSAERVPWQRADGTVARLQALDPAPEAVAVEGGAAIFRVTGGRVSLMQGWARDEERGRELLRAVAARGDSLHVLNLPRDDALAPAFAALGGTVDVRQREMVLAL